MKAVRWKKRYRTGNAELDEHNQALVALLNELRDELGKKEHCQEINELTDRLSELTGQRLAGLSEDAAAAVESDRAIRDLLRNDFPLATLSTPACRDCGLCDLVEDRVKQWLSEGGQHPGSPG